jgi:hypothetical protein
MSFPSVIGTGRYSIVKMSVIPSYDSSDIPKILNEYAFIIETHYSNDKKVNGFTTIDIVPINTLQLFNRHVENAMKFEYKGGKLVVNEFVEFIEDESTHGKKYVAILKNQLSKNKQYFYDKNILLCVDNEEGDKRLDNIPIAQLGPQFEVKIEYYRAKEALNKLRNIKRYFTIKHNGKNEDDKVVLTICNELLEKEYKLQEDKVDKIFNEYLKLLNS